MEIILKHKTKILKTIELTPLQLKAIRLTGQKPEDYLVDKLERILEFTVNQVKQTIDRISPLTNGELESMIDEIETEKEEQDEQGES